MMTQALTHLRYQLEFQKKAPNNILIVQLNFITEVKINELKSNRQKLSSLKK